MAEKKSGNMKYCQNKKCPHGREIAIAIYKGTGACCEDCMKAHLESIGLLQQEHKNLMALSKDEVEIIKNSRR